MFSLWDKQKRWIQLRKNLAALRKFFFSDLSITGHPDGNVWLAGAERVKGNVHNTSDFLAFPIFHISRCRNMIVTFPMSLYLGENYPKHGKLGGVLFLLFFP